MNKTIFAIAGVSVLAVILFVFFAGRRGPGKYDDLAICLKDNGVAFYGAFWCPHCQNQKKLFGSSSKLLPYVECSTADGNGQLAVCKDKNIESYPTWEFNDGSRETGEISLAGLAEKSGCLLPE